MSDIFKYLLKYEESWCNFMGYFNPYIDNKVANLTNKMPFYDKACYNRYPKCTFEKESPLRQVLNTPPQLTDPEDVHKPSESLG